MPPKYAGTMKNVTLRNRAGPKGVELSRSSSALRLHKLARPTAQVISLDGRSPTSGLA